RLSVDVHPDRGVPAPNSRRVAEVQGFRKRGDGGRSREPKRFQACEIIRSRRTEEPATSLPLQCELVCTAQGPGGQRVLQPTRGNCNSIRSRRRTLHRHRTRPSRNTYPRKPSSRQLLRDTALHTTKKRGRLNTRHSNVVDRSRKIPRSTRRET